MDPEVTGIIEALVKAITQPETAGILGIAIGVIYVLVRATKLSVLAPLFAERKWLRWVIAAVLGGLGAGLAAVAAGQGWLPCVVAGVVGCLTAGLGAVGADSAASATTRAGRDTAKIKAQVEALVVASDEDAAKLVEAAKAAVDAAAAIPAGPARRAALAAEWSRVS